MSGLWQENAACRDADPLRFFADGNTRDDLQQTAEEYCAGCTVRDECSDDADDHRDVGLRGGSYRTDPSRGYQRTPLIDGAADGQMPTRHREPALNARVDLDEVAFLTSCGLSREHVAARMGVKLPAIERAEFREAERARADAAAAAAVAVARAQQAVAEVLEDSEPVSWADAPTMQRALNEAFGDVA